MCPPLIEKYGQTETGAKTGFLTVALLLMEADVSTPATAPSATTGVADDIRGGCSTPIATAGVKTYASALIVVAVLAFVLMIGTGVLVDAR